MVAFLYGKHQSNIEHENANKDQIIQKEKTTNEVNKYNDNDFCVRVLHGKLSDDGNCL